MTQRRWVYVVLVLTSAQGLLAATTPVTVSPGQAKAMVPVESRCPTFSWGEVEGADSFDLVVYRIGTGDEEAQAVLERRFDGSVSSWTPSLESCLARGSQYAWAVRATSKTKPTDWS